jgi:hypothetical protein
MTNKKKAHRQTSRSNKELLRVAGFDKGAPQSLIGAHCFLGKNLFLGKSIKTAVFSGVS